MSESETYPAGTVNKLLDRIAELEDGSCRFHCTRSKQTFYAGFDAGMAQHIHWEDRHTAYEAFKQQRGVK